MIGVSAGYSRNINYLKLDLSLEIALLLTPCRHYLKLLLLFIPFRAALPFWGHINYLKLLLIPFRAALPFWGHINYLKLELYV